MTNGARKPSGIGSLCSGHFWQSVLLRLSRRARTYGELTKCDYAEQQVMVSSIVLTSSVAVIEQFPFA